MRELGQHVGAVGVGLRDRLGVDDHRSHRLGGVGDELADGVSKRFALAKNSGPSIRHDDHPRSRLEPLVARQIEVRVGARTPAEQAHPWIGGAADQEQQRQDHPITIPVMIPKNRIPIIAATKKVQSARLTR